LAWVLAGCETVPEPSAFREELPVPPEWAERAAAKPVADTDWVGTFGDAALGAVVEEALRENRDLGRLVARVRSAEAEAKIAGAGALPQVNGTFDATRSQNNFIGFPIGDFGGGPGSGGGGGGESGVFSTRFNTFGLALGMRWELDLWGRVRAGKRAALSQLQASRADYAAARLSLAGQTARAWFGLVAAREQAALARQALEVFQSTERTIEGEFREGIAVPGRDLGSELSLARVDVATARSNLAAREAELPRLQRLLEVLLGRYPEGALATASRLPDVPGHPPAGIPAEVLDRRPDLVAAERRLVAADKRVLEAKRSLLPAVSLTGSLGTSTPEVADILNGDFFVWNVANNLTQPLLDGQRLLQVVQARKADVDLARAEYEQAVLTAFQEVEDALAADRYLARQGAALAESVRLAEDALVRARKAYADGVGDALTMLNAQQRLIAARSSWIDVKRHRLENRINLHLALGGNFGKEAPAADAGRKGPGKAAAE
jgi:NodT family efflux transporter outer membrane factor (OMF) lipoprotein